MLYSNDLKVFSVFYFLFIKSVLMAMNIISKEKKEIKWIGLPCNKKQECQDLEVEKKEKEKRIQEKSDILKNLILEVRFSAFSISLLYINPTLVHIRPKKFFFSLQFILNIFLSMSQSNR